MAQEEAHLDFPIFCRKRGSMHSEELVILDVNKLAEVGTGCDCSGE